MNKWTKKNYADDNNSDDGNDEDKRVFFKISIFITNNGRQNPLPHWNKKKLG